MQRLLRAWRNREPLPQQCRACFQPVATEPYCSQACAHRHVLLIQASDALHTQLPLGMPKRVLEADDLNDLSDDAIVALLEVVYPLRETDKEQFRELASWRYVSQRYRRLIDTRIYAYMRALPHDHQEAMNDAVLRLFPRLVELDWTDGVSFEAVRQLRDLRVLHISYESDWRDDQVTQLTALTALSLHNDKLSGACLPPLVALQKLEIDTEMIISAPDLRTLTALEELELNGGTVEGEMPRLDTLRRLEIAPRVMSDAQLGQLVYVTRLRFSEQYDEEPERVTDAGLAQLTALRELSLHQTQGITSRPLLDMPDLRDLELGEGEYRDLGQLHQLTRLHPWTSNWLDDATLQQLTSLRWLDLRANDTVTDDGMRGLTQLETLLMSRGLSAIALLHVPQLRSLNVGPAVIVGPVLGTLTQLTELDLTWSTLLPSQMLDVRRGCRVIGADDAFSGIMRALRRAQERMRDWLQGDDNPPWRVPYDPRNAPPGLLQRIVDAYNEIESVLRFFQ